jgi:glycolate oxidase FAD binding subunit
LSAPVETFRPASDAEVVEIVTAAGDQGSCIDVRGAGSKSAIGRPVEADLAIDLTGLSGVVDYAPAELVLTARAGTPLAEVEALLAQSGQMLAFEPIDYGPLLGGQPGAATLGGVIAANASGPRRLKDGAARDHFLGFQAVSGRGEAFKAGGKVVKNVTGYDLSKLVAGSWGTLCVLTEVTLKVLPRPQTCATLLIRGLSDADAARAMSLACGSPADVSGAAHLPAGVAARAPLPGEAEAEAATLLRLEGFGPSVAARRQDLAQRLAAFGAPAVLDPDETVALWAFVCDVRAFAGEDRVVWRISAPPMHGCRILAAVQAKAEAAEAFYDWAGGLVWLALPPSADAGAALVRAASAAHGGVATLIRAPVEVRGWIDVFEPEAPALAALSRRVKAGFDPLNILNPGRMRPEAAR